MSNVSHRGSSFGAPPAELGSIWYADDAGQPAILPPPDDEFVLGFNTETGIPEWQFSAGGGGGGGGGVDPMDPLFGALGDGTTDDRVAFQAALDYAATLPEGRRLVTPSPGIYAIGRVLLGGAGTGLTIPTGVTLDGRGLVTIKMITDGSAGIRLLRFRGVQDIVIKNIILDGAWTAESGWDENLHLTEIGDGSSLGATHIKFQHVRFQNAYGDAFRCLGSVAGPVNHVFMDHCSTYNVKRAPVSLQREIYHIHVTNNRLYGGSDQVIDFEPTGTGQSPTYVTITGNVIIHQAATAEAAVSISGIESARPVKHVIFAHNHVIGGNVQGLDVEGLMMHDNYILGRGDSSSDGAAVSFAGAVRCKFQRNTVVRPAGADIAPVFQLGVAGGTAPSVGNLVEGNTFQQNANGRVAQFESGSYNTIRGNIVELYFNSTSEYGIALIATGVGTMEHFLVQGNTIRGNLGGGRFANAVRVTSASGDVGKVNVCDNIGTGISIGVEFAGNTAYLAEVHAANNSWTPSGGSTSAVVFGTGCTKAVIGGNDGGVGGVRQYIGNGAPAFTATIGSTFSRLDGAAASCFYVNVDGATTWTAIA